MANKPRFGGITLGSSTNSTNSRNCPYCGKAINIQSTQRTVQPRFGGKNLGSYNKPTIKCPHCGKSIE